MVQGEVCPCAVCGKDSSMVCARCKIAHYCSREHQKKAWKAHKKTCVAPVKAGDTCTRCLQVVEEGSNICRIPHPEDLQENNGSMYGGGVSHTMFCQACYSAYTKSSSNIDCPLSSMPITKGNKFCFEGPHTTQPLPKDDKRRIRKDLTVIRAGPNIQAEIDSLDGNADVQVLRICSEGFYSNEHSTKLAIRLPNLRELQLHDVSMNSIKLNNELTPKVETIWMQNPTEDDDPDFEILCPELKEFSCFYWGFGNPEWVDNMLAKATKLRSFDSYKFRVPYLKFASNDLVNIRLHRAECLQHLSIWAPRLTMLDVQAAYDLDNIVFLKDHPLKRDLPPRFHFDQELYVNSVNACLGPSAREAILNHERFNGALEEEEDLGGFASPMESLMGQTRGFGF